MPTFVDSHAHLADPAFAGDAGEAIARARGAGARGIVCIGESIAAADRAAALAAANPGFLWHTAGVHPHDAATFDRARDVPAIRERLRAGAVAVGECGLDYNRNYSPHPDQEKCFIAQLELGLELNKPLFLHSRDAHPRVSGILSSYKPKRAVAHCFTGEREELRAYLDLGLYIGITGWICDERRGKHLLELIKEIPPDRLLLETDSPYLTPRDLKPQPKARRNEPAFLPHIARTVARALGRAADQVAEETTRNARMLFGLKDLQAA